MMKTVLSYFFVLLGMTLWAQPNDCPEAVPGCNLPNFQIAPNNPATNITDFGIGTFSNPSTNPNSIPGNAGCLLTGETSSTFITIFVVNSGTLEWSIQGTGGCFDWIMWPYVNSSTTCSAILNNQLAPVACNWNAPCVGFTGMASAGNLPAGANQGNFENGLSVVAGQTYLLCLSNFSGTSQTVNMNFFGSANVACGVTAIDQTICQGSSANVTIATPGYANPVFNWLNTTGVSNPTAGTNVVVTPTQTTTYQVEVLQLPTAGNIALIDTATFTIFVEEIPVPEAGLPDTVCFGDPIQLGGAVTSLTNLRSWSSFSVGVSPPPSINFSPNFGVLNPTVNVNQPGLYGFVLRETSAVCGVSRDTVFVLSREMTSPFAVNEPSCEGASDASITLTHADAVNYSFDNGNTWSNSPTVSGLSAATYSVCVQDNNGCQACEQVVISNPSSVSMTVSADTTICQNGTVNMQATGNGGTAFTYNWSHSSSTNGQVTVMPQSSGYYVVQAVNQNGCESAPDSIQVTVLPPLSVDVLEVDTTCPGYPAVISASTFGGDGGPYNFVWSDGQTGTGLDHQITVVPSTTEQYTVSVSDGCETSTVDVTMEVPVAPLPNPAFDVVEAQICEPATFEMFVTTDPDSYSSATWLLSDGQFVADVSNFQTGFMPRGTYDVQLILTNAYGCIDSVTYSSFIEAMPKPEAKYHYTPNTPTTFNTKVEFLNFSNEAASYEWYIPEASPSFSTEESPTVLFPDGQSGNYEVFMIARSSFGCMDSVLGLVEIQPEVVIYAPNAFTPDYNDYNQTWSVHLQGIDEYNYELQIFNRWGQKVFETRDINQGWDGTAFGEVLPTGLYSYVIRTKGNLDSQPHVFEGTINLLK